MLYPKDGLAGSALVSRLDRLFDCTRAFGSTRQYESGDSLEFVRIEPGAMLMTPIDDHARSLLKIPSDHESIAGRTAPILDGSVERIATIDAGRCRFSSKISVTCRRCRAINERIEAILGCPQPMTFRTFLDLESAHFSRGHPTLATRTAQLGQSRLWRLRIECNPATKTESRVVQISRIALWTDQAAAINDLDDSGSAVVTELIFGPGNRATSATSADRRIGRRGRRRFERLATATIEYACRCHSGNIVLGMTICTGYELQADL